jgi:threonine/homoserine/homoserine lactone efflux protein
MDHGLAAFLAIAIVVIVTPGQDTALTIRNTLLGGRRAGVATAVGVAAGQLVWTVAASAGITAILVASEPVFAAIRLAGAAYLVHLGVTTLLAGLRGIGRHTGRGTTGRGGAPERRDRRGAPSLVRGTPAGRDGVSRRRRP